MDQPKQKRKRKNRFAQNIDPTILKPIAEQLYRGELFTDRHLPNPSDLTKVFMLIGMGAFNGYTKEELDSIGLVYEHIGKACPMAVNGMPTFLSLRVLNKHDTEYVFDRYEKMKKAVEAIG